MDKEPAGKKLAILGYASAILVYLPLMIFIAVFGVAVILNHNKGNKFASFHLRQMFGIGLLTIAASVFTNRIDDFWI